MNLFISQGKTLTPSDDGVPVEVAPLGEEGLHQQCEKVEALDEQPEVVGHDTVVEENHHRFTAHLREANTQGEEHSIILMMIIALRTVLILF